jgi:hypothetical protein
LPSLEQKIEEIKIQLAAEKQKTGIFLLFKEIEPANFAMKTMVNKLSGFAKFELNNEVNVTQFCSMCMKLSMAPKALEEGEEADAAAGEPELEFNQEKNDQVLGVFRKALIEDECPFKGDLSNE